MKLTPVKICRKLCIGNISLHYLNTFQCANSISLNLGQEFYFIFLISTFELPLCWFWGLEVTIYGKVCGLLSANAISASTSHIHEILNQLISAE